MLMNETEVKGHPPVPLTVEGASVLHQMMRVRWKEWNAAPREHREEIVREAAAVLKAQEKEHGQHRTAVYSLLGHKGDLMFLHFRRDFEELNAVELQFAHLRLFDFLEPATSFLSVIELSLHESSAKLYTSLAERGVRPHSPEWKREVEEVLARQSQAMAPRLWPGIPDARYICFYPMDRKRGERANWYQLPISDRNRMMQDHGEIGRRYAGEVRQIITGAIGFDDWEWGVDLFAEDPLVFKRLIYEMRFDEASALYALFGPFYLGLRCGVDELDGVLNGSRPAGKRDV